MFQKLRRFGELKRYYVDIKNLKKVPHTDIPHSFVLFRYVTFDKGQVWKDTSTGEFFVLDKSGVWNQEGIDHPLLN